ncbi:hypothetical protein AABM38_10160 [Heyndrickxia sp. MSNUG]|uniref:hypothetical protein n=1 Tax=Heyndrickxia sp. MSNUG TaxID=3136677 RepID=UPI003C2C5627
MSNTKVIINRLEEILEKIDEAVFTEADYPARGKYISPYASLSKKLLEDLRENVDELKEDEEVDDETLNKISDLIEEGGSIDQFASFDESREAGSILQDLPYDENVDAGEVAGQRAAEKRSELIDHAAPDLRELVEDLLPGLLNK